jgi:Zn-dependent protease with chaperone function
MDFFEAQEQAQKRTKWLVLWFALAVIAVVAAVDFLFYLFLGQEMGEDLVPFLGMVSFSTAGIIVIASLFKTMQLGRGGEVVAHDLGGRLVMPGSTDFQEKRLLNIVEEMAIASGMPVPQVFLMDEEESINAFAAGTEPSNAVIGVTRGCVQRLTREELEGVIAHEFSHILNGDMRLNMRLMGIVFGLLVISIIGRGMVEMLRYQSLGRRRNSKEGGGALLALFLIGLGLLVIGSLGVLFGRLIQAGISRQREFLADASAVQFTRNPGGISGALKKIGGLAGLTKMKSAKASEASHMFFSNGGMFSFGLATHPPLDVRIKAIEKNWDGEFSESELKPVASERVEERRERKSPFEAIPGGAVIGLAGAIGQEDHRQVETGHKIHQGLSESWKRAAHDRDEAQALIFGLLLAEDHQVQKAEVSYLKQSAGKDATELALQWQREVTGLHSARKIVLIDLALPTLRSLGTQESQRFIEISRWLIASDSQVDLFEFMIQRVIERHLVSYFEQRGFGKIRYRKLSQLYDEANVLVSTMAGIGAENETEAKAAYSAAIKNWQGSFTMHDRSRLDQLDDILKKIDQASPRVKKAVLMACARAAASDGDLTNREAELLRAIADALGCPVPPLISNLQETEN